MIRAVQWNSNVENRERERQESEAHEARRGPFLPRLAAGEERKRGQHGNGMNIGVIVGVREAVPTGGCVRVGVGVLRTQAPASLQAEST